MRRRDLVYVKKLWRVKGEWEGKYMEVLYPQAKTFQEALNPIKGFQTKREAIKECEKVYGGGPMVEPTSLRIHRRDGTFQEERTYPRAADPKKSKG